MIKDCCKKVENLKISEQTADKVIKVCKVCGCRHFEFTVDPVKLGIKFK